MLQGPVGEDATFGDVHYLPLPTDPYLFNADGMYVCM